MYLQQLNPKRFKWEEMSYEFHWFNNFRVSATRISVGVFK